MLDGSDQKSMVRVQDKLFDVSYMSQMHVKHPDSTQQKIANNASISDQMSKNISLQATVAQKHSRFKNLDKCNGLKVNNSSFDIDNNKMREKKPTFRIKNSLDITLPSVKL